MLPFRKKLRGHMAYKIVWHSNAPWVGSGYGNQTNLFIECMREDPLFDPVVSAFYGLRGSPIQAGGVKVLPATFEEYGQDVIGARFEMLKADAFIGLIDLWVYSDKILQSQPFTWWTPIDHNPAPPIVADKLQHVAHPWAMSKHGYNEMVRLGVNPRYVPHGTNIQHFKPMDRKTARAKFKWLTDDDFFIVSVAANKGKEDRKNLRGMIHAFAMLLKEHPNAKFYIHTLEEPIHDGINLQLLVKQLGLENHVFFPAMHDIVEGMYQYPQLNMMYNAADVFLLPSCGEGFGIPVIEAQAAGCPVIVNDFTAQGELVGAGIKIELDSDDLEYSPYGSYRARVRTSKVFTALRQALEWRGVYAMRDVARQFVVNHYDHKLVWEKHMKPALIEQITARRKLLSDRKQRTTQRLVMRTRSQERAKLEETQELEPVTA